MATYIPDGYTEAGYLRGVERLYEELRFTYRPATPEESAEFFDSCRNLKPREEVQQSAKFIRSKLVSWQLRDRKGDAVPLTPETVGHINRQLFYRLLAVIIGTEPCDADPNGGTDEKKGDERLEHDAKNS